MELMTTNSHYVTLNRRGELEDEQVFGTINAKWRG